jgi:hypothetical protein
MNIDTTGNIIILDEGKKKKARTREGGRVLTASFFRWIAHNIEGICRDAGSFEVDDFALRMIASELDQIIHNNILVSVHVKLMEAGLTKWLYQTETHPSFFLADQLSYGLDVSWVPYL